MWKKKYHYFHSLLLFPFIVHTCSECVVRSAKTNSYLQRTIVHTFHHTQSKRRSTYSLEKPRVCIWCGDDDGWWLHLNLFSLTYVLKVSLYFFPSHAISTSESNRTQKKNLTRLRYTLTTVCSKYNWTNFPAKLFGVGCLSLATWIQNSTNNYLT